jgi:hypothetical protein
MCNNIYKVPSRLWMEAQPFTGTKTFGVISDL